MLTLREHANRCAKDAMKMETGVGGGGWGGAEALHPAMLMLRDHTNCCTRFTTKMEGTQPIQR